MTHRRKSCVFFFYLKTFSSLHLLSVNVVTYKSLYKLMCLLLNGHKLSFTNTNSVPQAKILTNSSSGISGPQKKYFCCLEWFFTIFFLLTLACHIKLSTSWTFSVKGLHELTLLVFALSLSSSMHIHFILATTSLLHSHPWVLCPFSYKNSS